MTTLTADKKKAGHLRQQVPAVVPTDEEKNMSIIPQPAGTGQEFADDDGTVLDPDTGLMVFIDHGVVVLADDPTDDGEHHFEPDEARRLARALLHHADRAERWVTR